MIGRFDRWTTVVNWSALRVDKGPRLFFVSLLLVSSLLTSACTGRIAESASDRPGLGTTWGETRASEVEAVKFTRENTDIPDVRVIVFYNDSEGIERMIGMAPKSSDAPFSLPDSRIKIGIVRADRGWLGSQFFPTVEHSGNLYVAGTKGDRYSISVENLSKSKVEIVATVDGLDVIDGKPGSVTKPGYILDAGEKTVIEGFRRSMEEIAAFRFGSVSESYAQRKTGDSSNVGVIGLAVFREKGSPVLNTDDTETRRNANPFPGQFASPPDAR